MKLLNDEDTCALLLTWIAICSPAMEARFRLLSGSTWASRAVRLGRLGMPEFCDARSSPATPCLTELSQMLLDTDKSEHATAMREYLGPIQDWSGQAKA